MSSSHLKMVSPKQKTGKHYELLACQFLQQQGLQLIASNWLKAKVGEIDLIMIEQGKSWDTLVFVEVRVRQSKSNRHANNSKHSDSQANQCTTNYSNDSISNYGDALMSITKTKQAKLIKTARYFLHSNPKYQDCECRFDVIAFDITAEIVHDNTKYPLKQPTWIQGAFVANAW